MTQYLIMCRSLTYAQKASKLLERSGFTVTVVKAPQTLSLSGCAYAVTVRGKIYDAKQLLKKYEIPFGKVFRRLENGDYTEELT